jgi:2-oxoglutarate dehydrogenase E1 component
MSTDSSSGSVGSRSGTTLNGHATDYNATPAGPSFEQFGPNAGFVRELYALFLQDPSAVGSGWGEFFSNLGSGSEELLARAVTSGLASSPSNGTASAVSANGELAAKVAELASGFRLRGHLNARINPLSSTVDDRRTWQRADLELSLTSFGISESDANVEILFEGRMTTPALVFKELLESYTHTIGFEFEHLTDPLARRFLRERAETWRNHSFSPEQRRKIYRMLVEGETLESELHRKFVGQKRFSLQGGESLLPMLDVILNHAAKAGVVESLFGMAHRGRLDVLTSIAGKPFESLFNEFLDNTAASRDGDGDVKYHLGAAAEYAGVKVTLVPNPSHLEFVNCVVQGISRARQDIAFEGNRSAVLPIVIHGDAAFAGQGVVFETLGLSGVSTYSTGGTINIVINNQVGFTTRATEARSSVYCTDMAKAVEAPILHVNGDDPEACCWAALLAIEYRMRFARDVVLDMYCYRKYGHNEGDDPTFTQPVMYKEIQAKKSVMTAYSEKLVSDAVLSAEACAAEIAEFKKRFNAAEAAANDAFSKGASAAKAVSSTKAVSVSTEKGGTSRTITEGELAEISELLVSAPSGFEIHPKLKKILEKRNEALANKSGIEWGLAEALAFGTLLKEGISIRLSGQDCGRGTFSHRHLLLSDYNTAQQYPVLSPLASAEKGVRFDIMNSILSETAVMGFEFGYSSVAPKSLVIWEAQFGDFANGGQVIIDQFLAASKTKWHQDSALTLLLPHGFEGQGPEHSSARLERFLQLCAQENMMVCNPTSAAQIFHLLRRQALLSPEARRPLVVMSPKSLLRSPNASCTVEDLIGKAAGWKAVISEKISPDSKAVIGCSGKVAFDLIAKVKELGAAVDVLRLEQVYPLPAAELKKLIGKRRFVWAQEEPENMGAFRYLQSALAPLGITPLYAGRKAAASPATGSLKCHTREQSALVQEALDLAVKG